MKLDQIQESIVTAEIGIPIKVVASAGSGKTRVLTQRIRYILEHTKNQAVVAVTFTNKAADEIKERLSDLDDLDDRAMICTIHSFAQNVLESYAHTIGLPENLQIIENDKDRKEIFIQSLRENGTDIDKYLASSDPDEINHIDKILNDLLSKFSKIKRNLYSPEELTSLYDTNVLRAYEDYNRALIDASGVDFDDILYYAHRIFVEQEWCAKSYRAKYKHILVDEAQDLNRSQYEFLLAFSGGILKSVMLVGDPKQMIYGFNDSSSDFMQANFVADFSPVEFIMNKNYRSSLSVIKAANGLKCGAHSIDSIAYEGKLVCRDFSDEYAEAKMVADKIEQLIGSEDSDFERKVDGNDIVVIARTKYYLKSIEEEFSNRRLPFFYKKGDAAEHFSSYVVKSIDLFLKLLINPKNWVDVEKLFSCTGFKYNFERTVGFEVEKFLEVIDGRLSKIFNELVKIDVEEPMLHNCLAKCESIFIDFDFPDEEKEMHLNELKALVYLWRVFLQKNIGSSLKSFLTARALGKIKENKNEQGIVLSTVHTMKGLEAEIVFLVGMCEGVFPDYRAKNAKEIEEEQNNAYVAVTRAKRWLFVSYPKQRTMPWGVVKMQRPSRFYNLIESVL